MIGFLKYAPQYSLDKDAAAALVIARRGLGLKEKVPKNYRKFLIQSPQRESGTVEVSTNGRNTSTAGMVKTYPYNPWRVLRVAVLTALSPEGQKVSRCPSLLKPLLVSGEVGRTLLRGASSCDLGQGLWVPKYRQLGLGTLKKAVEKGGNKYPSNQSALVCTLVNQVEAWMYFWICEINYARLNKNGTYGG